MVPCKSIDSVTTGISEQAPYDSLAPPILVGYPG